MSLPAGYKAFCDREGMSVWHPDEWSEEQRARFYSWKLDWLITNMQALAAFDMPKIMPIETMISRIREYVDRFAEPPPSRPYKVCECHSSAPRRVNSETAPHGLAYIETFRRGYEKFIRNEDGR
jgi:hypothetical protein